MRSVDPATGQALRDYPEHDAREVSARLDRARDAFAAWRAASPDARAERLRALARALRAGRDRHAALMTAEMGKPIAQSDAEVEKCAWACDHFADHGAALLAPERVATEARASYVRWDPLGVVLAIMPWNFPFWQVFRCAVPALMAGNVVVLKHASNVPGCALAIEALGREAGLPEGVLATLLVSAERAEALIDDPRVAGVALTGSESAGEAIGRRAGAALKKAVLELGGSDPFLVLADADPVAAAEAATRARLINNGQSCIAAKRFIVEEPVAEAFERAFAARMERVRIGDPSDRAVELGPLARDDLRADLDRQVQASLAAGARLLARSRDVPGRGFFYPATVLAGAGPGMPAFDEETFGPVAAVVRARDTDHAVELANRSRYGLGASVWTRDPDRGEALAVRLEAGSVFVNQMVKSDPRLPFGGVKRSGHGRELGVVGMREFANAKTVWVE